MIPSLSLGAVSQMAAMQDKPPHGEFTPTLQVISIKEVQNGRIRAILSDGTHYVVGMLATQALASEMKQDCIIRVTDFVPNLVQGRIVIILLHVQVLEQYPDGRIGDPVNVDESITVAAPVAHSPQSKPLYNSTNENVTVGATTNNYNTSTGRHNEHKPINCNSNSNSYTTSSPGNPYQQEQSYHQQHQQAPIHRVKPEQLPNSGITPIAGLNMYNNRWTIQARVTTKSDIRTWSNAKGEGSLFSVELLDSSMDIRGTFFKEAVDKFYHVLEVGKIYTFAGGRLKQASLQYNTCKSNIEITFDQNSEIHLADDDGRIQYQAYDFKKIVELEALPANSNVDVLAIVKSVGEPANIIAKKSGQELTKCDLTLVDDTGVEINLTLWGNKAVTAPSEFADQPVVAFRRARVSDYGGKSLSLAGSYEVNPSHVPQQKSLQHWWNSIGSHGGAATRSLSSASGGAGRVEPLSNRKTIDSIKNESMGLSNDQADWIAFKGTLTFLRKDKEGGAWYPACANSGEPCKNRFKMTQTTDGQWYCDKCANTYPQPVRRWIFSGVVEDATSSTWVSFFNEQAETLFGGMTADQLYQESYGGGAFDQDRYDSVFVKPLFTEWIFKCKVKNELHNDESRVKTSVHSLFPVDYAKESLELLDAIEKF